MVKKNGRKTVKADVILSLFSEVNIPRTAVKAELEVTPQTVTVSDFHWDVKKS